MRGAALTLSEEVYSRLRNQILTGVLVPGAKLKSAEIKADFNVSLGVVREALTRLSEQQLVVAAPNQGFTVAELSERRLRELVQVRTEVEGFAVGLAVVQGNLDWEGDVIAAHHRLERTPLKLADGEPNPEWATAHAQFHAQLIAGCGNGLLSELCSSLFHSAELYRIWSDPLLNEYRDVAGEHRALMESVVARDAARATELLRAHIELTGENALRNFTSTV